MRLRSQVAYRPEGEWFEIVRPSDVFGRLLDDYGFHMESLRGDVNDILVENHYRAPQINAFTTPNPKINVTPSMVRFFIIF